MLTASFTAEILNRALNQEGSTLRLFINARRPCARDFAAQYEELEGHGYRPKIIPARAWRIVEGEPSTASAPIAQFKFSSAPPLIYGLFLTRGSALLWAERLPEPWLMINAADTLEIVPSIYSR